MTQKTDHLNQPVLSVARRDVTMLRDTDTVQEALTAIRGEGVGGKIVYFYVTDSDNRLVGVLPTRRLLTAAPEQRLTEIMVQRVVAVPATATILEACEAFVMHKFLAFPVVDERRRVVGVVDVDLLAEEAFDMAEREQTEALFESIGLRLSQVRDASPVRAFRFRFPWLLATIGSGTICALLAGAYEMTLARSLVLAFFITLVLGLAESVSMQTMTVTIQALRAVRPSLQGYVRSLRREVGTSILLGVSCGTVVGLIVWLWRGAALEGLVIGSSILLALGAASFFGLSVPTLLHAVKLDPKIAAGPVTLAFTDISTLLFYFTVAALLL